MSDRSSVTPGRKTGRPRSLTPAKAKRIVAALRTGAPFRLAAAAGGISPNTLDRCRDPDSPTYDACFAEECERAREEGFLRLYERVHKAQDWRAARWQLEVGLPDLFSRRVTVGGDVGNPVRVQIQASLVAAAHIRGSRDLLMKLVDELAKLQESPALAGESMDPVLRPLRIS